MHSEQAQASVGRRDTGEIECPRQQAAFIAWVTRVAPGITVSLGFLLLALLVAPLLTPRIYVESAVRRAAALLLMAHVVSTLWTVRVPGEWSTRVFCLLLVIDAVLSGVVAGAPWQVSGVALPLVVVLGALSMVIAGSAGVVCAAGAVAIGVAAAGWYGVGTPLIFSPTPVAATILSADERLADLSRTDPRPGQTLLLVEPYFGGVLTSARPDYSFATELIVEPHFAGIPGMGSTAELFPAALSVALLALCSGSFLSLLRVRGAPPCPDAQLDAPE